MNLSKFQNGRPWFYCLFSFGRDCCFLTMNKLKNEKETQLKLKSLHKKPPYITSYQRLNPDNHFNYEKIN
jgi:hypothetical protein